MLNLSCKKTYDGKVVLDVGGLIFEKGKRYAVIGSNGSGKTTMLKIIGGVIKPDKNAIFETDFPGGGNTICYMSQTSYAFDMSLKRNVYVACPDLPRIKSRDTRLYYKNRCNDLIRDMGLWELKNKNALKLSGGETQRMALCRVFADTKSCFLTSLRPQWTLPQRRSPKICSIIIAPSFRQPLSLQLIRSIRR